MGLEVEWVTIGAVTAPHGVRGEVRVMPLTDFPDRFFELERVFVVKGDERVERRGPGGENPFPGVVLAEAGRGRSPGGRRELRGAEIQVPRADVVPLPPGVYYVFELVERGSSPRKGPFWGGLRTCLPPPPTTSMWSKTTGGGRS